MPRLRQYEEEEEIITKQEKKKSKETKTKIFKSNLRRVYNKAKNRNPGYSRAEAYNLHKELMTIFGLEEIERSTINKNLEEITARIKNL